MEMMVLTAPIVLASGERENGIQLERNGDRSATKLGLGNRSLDLVTDFLSLQYLILVG